MKIVWDRQRQCLVEKDTGDPVKTPKRLKPFVPQVAGDYAGYTCPITGKWIEGRAAHEENLKRHGCRVAEKGEDRDNARERARQDRVFEQRLEGMIARTVNDLGL